MSSNFGSHEPNHTAALAAVDEARQEALQAVSEMRQFGAPRHHPNLAPADGPEKELATICTQKVVDYLLQLRPYRENSQNWDVDLGALELPKELPTEGSNRRGGGVTRNLWLCRQPHLPLRNVSDVIEVANMTVQYSTRRGDTSKATVSGDTYHLRTNTEYGELIFRNRRSWLAASSGQMSYEQAVESGAAVQKEEIESKSADYTPATPANTDNPGLGRGTSHETRSYNVVFPASTLLYLVELADEVAAEIDILIELEAPDYDSDGQGAV